MNVRLVYPLARLLLYHNLLSSSKSENCSFYSYHSLIYLTTTDILSSAKRQGSDQSEPEEETGEISATKRPKVSDCDEKRRENLKKHNIAELKAMCREQGLPVGGPKYVLLDRLLNPDAKRSQTRKRKITLVKVNSMLEGWGLSPQEVAGCVKAGIQNHFIDTSGDSPLENVVCVDSCFMCGEKQTVRLKDVLYQPDYAGLDYEDGGQGAPFQCINSPLHKDNGEGNYSSDCGGLYVTGLCYGNPKFDCGKFHNHCRDCKGFGQCVGDYRTSHCDRCGNHYFSGNSGFACNYCSDRGLGSSDDEGGGGGNDCRQM